MNGTLKGSQQTKNDKSPAGFVLNINKDHSLETHKESTLYKESSLYNRRQISLFGKKQSTLDIQKPDEDNDYKVDQIIDDRTGLLPKDRRGSSGTTLNKSLFKASVHVKPGK